MANGLFNEPLQPAFWRLNPFLADTRWEKYVQDMIKEIYRVTPNIFFGHGINPIAKQWCYDIGFEELDPVSAKNSIHADPSKFFCFDLIVRNLFLFQKKA